MANDAQDVGELQKALNDVSGKASVLWTTFITLELYLAIAFGSVTHRDLFLETPIKLPLLNVDLPLVGFFVVAPLILIIFHFYIFLQLFALTKKASDYDVLLRQQTPVASDRRYLRQRLDSFLILQLGAGPAEQRTGFAGFSLRLIGWFTLVGLPIVILLQGQLTFLPYHLEWVVWLQRVAFLMDLATIWYFWNRVRGRDEPIVAAVPTWTWEAAGLAASLLLFFFSVSVATFPGERANIQMRPWTLLQGLLFSGASELSAGLFSNHLMLNDQSFVDVDKLDKVEVSHSFRGRDLREAVLARTDLRKADFTAAFLVGAKLDKAKLQNARFGCAVGTVGENGIHCSNLALVSLQSAQLQGAKFVQVEMRGADLAYAELQGATMNNVDLQGAYFNGAYLQGADLEGAFLQGATLIQAQMQGAFLERAQLQGANLEKANLQGAFLGDAQLQGANFDSAQLQGAYLAGAGLQGANLDKARIRGASLAGGQVWRARGHPEVELTNLNAVGSDVKPWERRVAPLSSLEEFLNEDEPATQTFAAWRDRILRTIPADGHRQRARERISVLDPATPEKEPADTIHAEFWRKLASAEPEGEGRQKQLSSFLADLACSGRSAPHVATGLIRFGLNETPRTQFAAMQKRLWKARSDQTDCPGAKGLSVSDWSNLDDLKEKIDGSYQ